MQGAGGPVSVLGDSSAPGDRDSSVGADWEPPSAPRTEGRTVLEEGLFCPQSQSASATPLRSPSKGCSSVLGGWALCQAASHPLCILQLSHVGCSVSPDRPVSPPNLHPQPPRFPSRPLSSGHPLSQSCPLSPDCALCPPRWPHQSTSQCQNRNGTAGPQPPQAALLSPAGSLSCSQPARTNAATQEAWGIPAPCLR